jgi:hypothetical protein
MPKRRSNSDIPRDPPEIIASRRTRTKLWKEAGSTLNGYFGYIRGIQAGLAAAGILIAASPSQRKRSKRTPPARKRAA